MLSLHLSLSHSLTHTHANDQDSIRKVSFRPESVPAGVKDDGDGVKYWDLTSGALVRDGGGSLKDGRYYSTCMLCTLFRPAPALDRIPEHVVDVLYSFNLRFMHTVRWQLTPMCSSGARPTVGGARCYVTAATTASSSKVGRQTSACIPTATRRSGIVGTTSSRSKNIGRWWLPLARAPRPPAT